MEFESIFPWDYLVLHCVCIWAEVGLFVTFLEVLDETVAEGTGALWG